MKIWKVATFSKKIYDDFMIFSWQNLWSQIFSHKMYDLRWS